MSPYGKWIGWPEAAAFLGICFDYTICAGALQVQAEGPADHPVARCEVVNLSVPPDQCRAFPGGGAGVTADNGCV